MSETTTTGTAAATDAAAAAAPAGSVFAALRLGARGMRRHPGLATLFLFLTVLQGSLQGVIIWALRGVLVKFSAAGNVAESAIFVAALGILGLWLTQSAAVFVGDVVSARLAYRVEHESMLEVLAKLLRMSIGFFDRHSHGDLVMGAYYDLKGIRNVTLEMGRAADYTARLAGLAIVAWLMSPKLAIIGLFAVPLGAIPAYWIGRRITAAASSERTAVTTLYDSFIQLSGGIRVLRVNRGESRFLERARGTGTALYRSIQKQVQSRGLARFLLESVSGLGLILVLTIGGRDVAAGRLPWQSLMGLLVAVMAVYGPVVGLLQMYGTIRSVIPNLAGVAEILRSPDVVERPGEGRPLPAAPERIRFEDVTFGYQGQTVLRGVNAEFHRGETIGIVGPSGAGKSTLMSLLLRFYEPTSGRVLFDGVDARQLRHADLMDRSAIVLQEPFLFIDTLANNIRLGRPDASMDEVEAAARAADVHDEIAAMDDGYETVIGRGQEGRGLSVGQKQRVCIAAALLKNAPLLFLDEATSNLDSVSERKVQAAIERLMAGRTAFVIAHRLSTLRRADRILVLEEGRVVGLGRHEDLLRDCAVYADLWAHQGGGFLDRGAPETAGAAGTTTSIREGR